MIFEGKDISPNKPNVRAAMGLARTFQNVALFRGLTVLDNIKLGGHNRMAANTLEAMAYWGRSRRQEMALREEIERDVIDFLEIDHIRHQSVASL
jgi:branched-chain amino acid transport system ATP-binding protein